MNPEASTIRRIKNSKRELEEKLLEPYTYILQMPGMDIRGQLLDVFDYWLEVPKYIMVDIFDIITMFLNAHIMLDDIQDESKVRRGIPSAHIIFGIPATMNAAYYVVFTAFQKAHYLTSRKGHYFDWEFYLKGLRGQGEEIHRRDNLICPTEEEYCRIASRKTGGFVELGINIMEPFSKKKYDFTTLTTLTSLYFQIQNDYINLASPIYHQYKGFCEDITEGKFSYPIVHAINSDPNSEVLEILKIQTTDVELKKRCLSLIEKCGSLEYTKNKLNFLLEEILKEVEKLGGHPTLKKYFDQSGGAHRIVFEFS